MTRTRNLRWPAFLAVAFAINLTCILLVRSTARPEVGIGTALDMAVTVPALYFFLIIRGGLQPAISLVPLCLLGLLRATYFAPQLALGRPVVAAAAEIAIIAIVVVRLRYSLRASHAYDLVERLDSVARDIVPIPRIASILATELAVFWYAIASWRARPAVPASASAFTLHRQSGVATLFGFLAGVSLMEAALVHLVVARWSSAAAWLLTGISVYGAIWFIAVARSLVLRPVLITRDEILARAGLFWTIRISVNSCSIERFGGRCDLHAPMLAEPNLVLRLNTPVTARGMYGIQRQVSTIALSLDDAKGFSAAVAARAGNRPS